MVNCTLNKNEYRSTFIATLINNWYTTFYKRNHRHSQYNYDTEESLQIEKLEVAQEGPTNILIPVLTLTMTSYASSSNKPTTLVQLLDTISTTLIIRKPILVHKTPPKVEHDVTLAVFSSPVRTRASITPILIIIFLFTTFPLLSLLYQISLFFQHIRKKGKPPP